MERVFVEDFEESDDDMEDQFGDDMSSDNDDSDDDDKSTSSSKKKKKSPEEAKKKRRPRIELEIETEQEPRQKLSLSQRLPSNFLTIFSDGDIITYNGAGKAGGGDAAQPLEEVALPDRGSRVWRPLVQPQARGTNEGSATLIVYTSWCLQVYICR